MSVLRNLSIDWRWPRSCRRSTAAGASATIAAAPPGEADIILGRPMARAPSSPQIPDQQFLEKEVAAAPPRRLNQIERVSPAPHTRGIDDNKVTTVISVLWNSPIDRRRPRTSLRSTGAGTIRDDTSGIGTLRGHSTPPLNVRFAIHQRAVPEADGRSRCGLLDEPLGQCLGQRRDGELLLVTEDRAYSAQNLSDARPSQARCVRLAPALDNRLNEPHGVRAAGGIRRGSTEPWPP